MLVTPKKYAIYTAMVGGYDEIKQPKVVDDRFDYILFSNDIKEDRVGAWQVRPICYHNDIQTKIARYIKTHPEELLPDYDFTVWIDSNIRILTPFVYERTVQLYSESIQIASMNHLERNCIYDEAFTVLDYQIEYESVILDWCHFLRKKNYPKDNGLFETGVMYRINNNQIKHLDDLWWYYIDNYSKRDQLSFNFVLWETNTYSNYILPPTINIGNSIDFGLLVHKNATNRGVYYKNGLPWLMRYYLKRPQDKELIKNVYYRIYGMKHPRLWAYIYGQYYRVKYLIQKKLL